MRRRLVCALGMACALAYLLHPAIWPALWLGLYCTAQAVDYALFLAVLNDRPKVREWHLLTSLVANVVIFSSITAYNWFFGGTAGKMNSSAGKPGSPGSGC